MLYDVVGPDVWHERLITASDPGRPGWYSVVTPDDDHYVEDLSPTCVDVEGLRALDRQGATPAGIRERDIYRFPAPPPLTQLRLLFRDGALLLGVTAPPVEHGVAPPGGVLPRSGRATLAQPPGHVWVVTEDVETLHRGDIVAELSDQTLVLHGKALMPLPSGDVASLRSMARNSVAEYVNDDLRVLPVKFEFGGRRHRPFGEAVDMMTDDEPQGGLMLEGPSSVLWLAQPRRDAGGSFTMGHDHWVRTAGIGAGDRSVHEHEVLARILDAMVSTDQLNLPALQSAELAARRLQLVEEAHRISPSSPDYSASDHFMGWTGRQHGAMVAPRMRDHVATHLRGDAAVAKEARKSAEETRLRRSGNNNNNKKGGPAGDGAADSPKV